MVLEHHTCFNYRENIRPGKANNVRFSGADIVYYNGVVVNQSKSTILLRPIFWRPGHDKADKYNCPKNSSLMEDLDTEKSMMK
jgi:hypothetical protein